MTDTLIQRLSDEADLCRNDGATDVAKLLDDAVYALVNQAARLAAAAEIVSAQPAAPAEPKGADGLPVSAPRLYADEEPPGHADHVSKARDLFDAAPSVAPEPAPVAYKVWHREAKHCFCLASELPTEFRSDTGEPDEYFGGKVQPLFAHPPRAPLTPDILLTHRSCYSESEWAVFVGGVRFAEMEHGIGGK